MSFEEELRNRISKAPHGSMEKNLLKVVLGEVQQKSAMDSFSDEMGYSLVKKMIKANEENVGRLPSEDPRHQQFLEENKILDSLLPQYWSVEKIQQQLEADGVDVKAAKNDGQATGMAMKHLKSINALVEGDTVREAVARMRSA